MRARRVLGVLRLGQSPSLRMTALFLCYTKTPDPFPSECSSPLLFHKRLVRHLLPVQVERSRAHQIRPKGFYLRTLQSLQHLRPRMPKRAAKANRDDRVLWPGGMEKFRVGGSRATVMAYLEQINARHSCFHQQALDLMFGVASEQHRVRAVLHQHDQ